MINQIPFGFAFRHRIYYNTFIKRGHIMLWSFYEGKLSGKNPNALGRSFISKVFAGEYSKLGITWRTKISIEKGNDLLSFLIALEVAIKGKRYIFENYEGREISFIPNKEKNKEWEIIVKVGSNEKTGKLLFDEAKSLSKIMKGFLLEIGYVRKEVEETIAKRVEENIKDEIH